MKTELDYQETAMRTIGGMKTWAFVFLLAACVLVEIGYMGGALWFAGFAIYEYLETFRERNELVANIRNGR